MITKITIKVGNKEMELTPDELEELKQDILKVSPDPVYMPPVVIPAPNPPSPYPPPWEPYVTWVHSDSSTDMRIY